MIDAVGPLETKFLEYELEDGEMVVLLVAHHIYMGVQMVLGETPLGSSEILGDIH